MKMVIQDHTQVLTIGTTKMTGRTQILKKNSLIKIITRKMRGSDVRAITNNLRVKAIEIIKTIIITTITTPSKLKISLLIIPTKTMRATTTRTILTTRVDTKRRQ